MNTKQYGKQHSKLQAKWQDKLRVKLRLIRNEYEKSRQTEKDRTIMDRKESKAYRDFESGLKRDIDRYERKKELEPFKTVEEDSKTKLIQELKYWIQKFVRLRDTDKRGYGYCISCVKKIHRREGNGGHGVPATYAATRFLPENINLQCVECNQTLGGNREGYAKGIDEKYGKGTADRLLAMKNKQVDYTHTRLKKQIEKYKKLCEVMENEKINHINQ